MRRGAMLVSVLGSVLLAACGGSDRRAPGRTATPAATTATTAVTTPAAPATDAAGCVKVAQPPPKGEQRVPRPTAPLAAGRAWTVTLQTNCGAIEIRLDVRRAPKTAASFAHLARTGFYDGLTFHRVVADFVVQGGDPLGNGQGGPGYQVVERPPAGLAYTRGLVAMAKAGVDPAGASGSQFFIVTAQDAQLDPLYALVGRVVKGMDAVDRISAEPVNAASRPYSPVVIEKAAVRSG